MYLTARPQLTKTRGDFPRIIGCFTDTSASTYYRLQVPLTALAEAGYPVAWGPLEWFMAATKGRPELYDMALISRTGNGDPARVRAAIQSEIDEGHRVVMDYDDDVLHIPEHSPAYRTDSSGAEAAMRIASGLTVTNAELATVVQPHNQNVVIIPNYLDIKQWKKPLSDIGQVRIGLFGTSTHGKDWEIVAEPLKKVKQKYPKVEIVCGGYTPSYLKGIATSLKWRPMSQYQRMLQGITIGLCPLTEDHFNRCKSGIKAMEYGMAGAVVVGSPTQYGPLLQEGRGVIAETEEDWYRGIVTYIKDAQRRQRDAKALRQWLITTMDVRLHTEEIAAAYRQVYSTA
jgi:O-antigen biosynthesis protein